MGTCTWFWDDFGWVESPYFPHNCPPGQHCDKPVTPGTEYGQEMVTSCAL